MLYCKPFKNLGIGDLAQAGGKNASLGEMISSLSAAGVQIPDGFAVLAHAYDLFLDFNKLRDPLKNLLDGLDKKELTNLHEIGKACRDLVATGSIPDEVADAIRTHYSGMSQTGEAAVAVRSSATAEDLPEASFAGQHDSFLNVTGADNIISTVVKCYVSLFNDRAIKYRIDHGFDHMKVALSAGIQQMVCTDNGTSGVAFTIDPESGHSNIVYITASWGLGENIVQGTVEPDEFLLFKPVIGSMKNPLLRKVIGKKEKTLIFATSGSNRLENIETPEQKRKVFCISDKQATDIGLWCLHIENHYQKPMDIEWAIDGATGKLFILQARPETVHGENEVLSVKEFRMISKPAVLCTGNAVGRNIVSGRAVKVSSLSDSSKVKKGDIIVADITNPDWNALLRRAVCIVTNKGGRTSHASIVARELGIHAVVGTSNATDVIQDGSIITVSCIEGDRGVVYDGKAEWEEKAVTFGDMRSTKTKPMLILADPSKAFRMSQYPSMGVGLLRMEFIINNLIGIHPMALAKFDSLPEDDDKNMISKMTDTYADRTTYFTDTLASGIAVVAAAFYPRDVIVRMSDFKTNEYRMLLGGAHFEPQEENPMIGFRGASRYYNDRYREGFGLECRALMKVRDEMGLTNVKAMIPFCRTVDEGKKVLETMETFGLVRGVDGLQIYVMAEIPSNVILAKDFAEIFDGFSIGSNDLTQLTLGIDRDSSIISELFDENNPAVLEMLRLLIKTAHENGVQVGLCGQAPSDHPAFAQFLVDLGIDSISFNADALLSGINNIKLAEKELKQVRMVD